MHVSKPYAILLTAILLAGCSSNPFTGETQISNAALGAGGGAALGAGAGLATGSLTNADAKQSALIGAGVGAVVGGGIGLALDSRDTKIARELEAAGVSVTRSNKQLQLNMNKSVQFMPGSSALAPEAPQILDAVTRVLAEYPRSHATIAAFATASENTALFKRRSATVANYLIQHGVDRKRLSLSSDGGDSAVLITLDRAT